MPASELYACLQEDDVSVPSEAEGMQDREAIGGVEYDIVGEDGQVVMRTNRQTIDDTKTQIMTMGEIESLKASGTGSGKELISKLLESHSALDQKTKFALAKYTLRKTKKYMKRFTVLPLDVAMLAKWILCEKDAGKIMEMRQEMLALIGSWSNVHFTPADPTPLEPEQASRIGGGRWLVVDDTAGLVTAYMAEKMGILCSSKEDRSVEPTTPPGLPSHGDTGLDTTSAEQIERSETLTSPESRRQPRLRHNTTLSTTNTITLIHSLSQPNLSLLRYFTFDVFNPPFNHPLTTRLKTLSWLQLLDPISVSSYAVEPPHLSPTELSTMKPSKRSTYYRKRRRWDRIHSTVTETRAGGFDGLVVAAVMSPLSILHHLVPLLRGGAQVAVYSPHLEPLAELADAYSTARKTAFIAEMRAKEDKGGNGVNLPNEDFPLDPRLILAPTIQTARARPWQNLPGRTHPIMIGRGGAEGFLFTGTRVIPAEGRVEARGNFKRRKFSEKAAEGAGRRDGLEEVKAEDLDEGSDDGESG